MTSESSEVINCPNCKEDVPKTLYCLNCGYPLYKLEQKKIEESIEEPETRSDEIDMSVEIMQPEVTESVEEPEPEVDFEIIEVEEESEPETETLIVETPEDAEIVKTDPIPEPELEAISEPEPEPMTEPEPEMETVIEVEYNEPDLVEEEPIPEPEEEKVLGESILEPEEEVMVVEEPISEPMFEPEVEKDVFTMEERDTYMNEVKIEFAPDPLTQEVMENLAKNITLKIRLVRLLRESQVKEETFKRLFDSYVEQGRLWVSRREETIRRFKADIERMEDELVTARKDFELLEIRKNIGDASEQEYGVKAPAYKWDIENLDKGIKNTKGGIQYVINLKGLIPDEEVAELKTMAESNYGKLDDVEGVTDETIARMKESLADALASLEN